jgi:outer membrane lipoprotein-sorting protein
MKLSAISKILFLFLSAAASSLLVCGPAPAATDPAYSATEVFDHVLETQEAQAWSQADVVKEERAPGQKKPDISKGHLLTAPGGLARLELTKPSKGLIVSDGKTLWVELPEVEQVMRYSSAKMRQSGNFFLDLAPTIRHYSQTSYRRLMVPGPGFDSAKVSALELQPLQPSQAGFEKLQVWVDQGSWTILQVRLNYGGTESTVHFSHAKAVTKADVAKDPKQDMDPARFTYKAPKGFEIFDLDL